MGKAAAVNTCFGVLKGRDCIYRHDRLFTYDDVYNIIAVSYEFVGDPFLRRFLKERYQAAKLPYPPEALREDILRAFAGLTGELPEPGKRYYVERFAKTHVGMSTGWLSGDFWQAAAIPLLMERLEQTNRSKECIP